MAATFIVHGRTADRLGVLHILTLCCGHGAQGRSVVVLASLKPRNMRGVKSHGMLLCASNDAHDVVELLRVPEGAEPGERIWFGEADPRQADAESPNKVGFPADPIHAQSEVDTCT